MRNASNDGPFHTPSNIVFSVGIWYINAVNENFIWLLSRPHSLITIREVVVPRLLGDGLLRQRCAKKQKPTLAHHKKCHHNFNHEIGLLVLDSTTSLHPYACYIYSSTKRSTHPPPGILCIRLRVTIGKLVG